EAAGQRLFVALNLSPARVVVPLPGTGRILVATGMDRDGVTGRDIEVESNEGIVVLLDKPRG
ncbi:MAG TPA: hypothetical protein VGC90_05955, partial [Candidatus Limnocylindrales bacterium]